MIVYPREIQDGLEEQIKANASIAVDLELTPVKPERVESVIAKAALQESQFDLYYMTSILASVGWNKNDDIFTVEDTWGARHTPVNKKFNYMHNEADIIGHMTSSWVLDESGVIVTEDNIEQTGIPRRFDLVVASVLYKVWENPELQDRMNKLVAEIEEGNWYVSMECLFKGFDYGLKDNDGNVRVVARNGDTAFLTKYLRSYGGNGVYNGEQIGRVLRDFTFSGKGLVDKPANSRSIILNSKAETRVSNNEDNLMPDTTLDELKAKLDEAVASVTSHAEEKVKLMTDKTNLEASIAELTAQLEVAKTEAAIKAGEVEVKSGELTKANEDLATVKKQLEDAQAELATLKNQIAEEAKAAKLKTRKTKLTSAGVEDADADTVLAQWESVGDDLFDQYVTVLAAKKMADDEKKKKEDEAKAAQLTDEEKAKAAELAKASVDTEPSLTDDANANSLEKTIAAVSANLGKYLKTTKKN